MFPGLQGGTELWVCCFYWCHKPAAT